MDSSLAYISVEIPKDDMSLMEMMAQRMGWKVKVTEPIENASSGTISQSLQEAANGETKQFNTVEDLMKDLLE